MSAAVKKTLATAVVMALCACFGATLARHGQRPQRALAPTAQDPAGLDQRPLPPAWAPEGLGERALARMAELCAMGPRHTGKEPTPGWSRQLDYIEKALAQAGLEPKRDVWTDRRELLTFTNVWARVEGKRKDRIVLACHHDTKCTQGHAEPERNFPFVGANDGASAVALLLELAAVIRAAEPAATIDLVFFDGEESLDWSWNQGKRALFGSRRFVERHRDRRLVEPDREAPIVAMILLDMVARTDLHIQEELYSTSWLRRLVVRAADATGHRSSFYQKAEAASDDHMPFLDVGIPAVDLIDLKDNPHWHKPTDTMENCSAKSLQKVADVVLTLLPAVAAAALAEGR